MLCKYQYICGNSAHGLVYILPRGLQDKEVRVELICGKDTSRMLTKDTNIPCTNWSVVYIHVLPRGLQDKEVRVGLICGKDSLPGCYSMQELECGKHLLNGFLS